MLFLERESGKKKLLIFMCVLFFSYFIGQTVICNPYKSIFLTSRRTDRTLTNKRLKPPQPQSERQNAEV